MNKKSEKTVSLSRIWLSTEFLIGLLLLIVNGLVVFGWLTNNEVLKHPFGGPTVGPGTVMCSVIVAAMLIASPLIRQRPKLRSIFIVGVFSLSAVVVLKSLSLIYMLPLMRYVNIYEALSFTVAAVAIATLQSTMVRANRISQLLGSLVIATGVISISTYVYNIPNADQFLTFYGASQNMLIGVGILSLSVYAFRVFKLRLILLGMFVLTGLVFVTSATSQSLINDYKSATANVQHTYEVIETINSLRSEIVSSETGQRGYIITEDEAFLEPYNQNISQIQGTFTKLFTLTKDNALQQTHKDALKKLIDRRIETFGISLQYIRDGRRDEVIAAVKRGTGKKIVDDIRKILAEMEAGENALLQDRTTLLNKSADSVGFIRIVSTSVGILLLVVVVASVLRSIRKLEESSKSLLASNKELAVAKAKDEALLGSIGDGVFALDMKGMITLFNPSAERLAHTKKVRVIGRHYSDVLQFVDAKTGAARDGFIHEALGGELSSIPTGVVLKLENGMVMPVADSAAPIYDSDAVQTGIIVVFRDVTKEIELEKTKNDFVSLASHQLRTPLSAINWFGEMLLNGDAGKLNADQAQFVKEIHDGNARMIDLVNSLLDVSRFDLGKLKSNPEDIAIKELVTSLQLEMQSTIDQKRLKFTTHIDKKLQHFRADPKLLRMIMQNLLSNAVKYTPENGSVTLRVAEDEYRPRSICISVQDTGYGIPESQKQNIFSKLFRADNVQKLGIEGTGLGLYIVKAAAERMRGKAWFESDEGKGTTFFVSLPHKQPREVQKHV